MICWGIFGYRLSRRLLPIRGVSLRLLTAVTLSLGAATSVFLVLAFTHAVGIVTLSLTAFFAAACSIRVGRRGAFRQWVANDRRALQLGLKALPWPVSCVLGAVLATLFILDCASLATPILGWDSLNYHLVRVAYWAQDAGFSQRAGVDAWSYYAYFPIGGEILWAWVSIPLRCSALVGTAGTGVVLIAALAAFVCARSLGATRTTATLAACAIAANPAVLRFATNGYVDNVLLAYTGTSIALVFRAKATNEVRASIALCLLAAIASGLALLTKINALPAVGLVWAIGLTVVVRHRISVRSRLLLLLTLTLIPILIFGPNVVSTWILTGSPTYPLQLSLVGKTLFKGDHQLLTMLQGHFLPIHDVPFETLLRRLFFDTFSPQSPHTNFGKGGLLVTGLGLLGLAIGLMRHPKGWQWLVLVALAATCLPLFTDPNVRALRGLWWWVSARLMLLSLFAFAVLATSIKSKIAATVLGLAAIIELPSYFNLGLCNYRWLSVVVCGVTIGLGGLLVWGLCRSRARRTSWGAVGTITVLLGLELAALRPELEPLTFAGALRKECFEAHPLNSTNMATRVWATLRDAPSRTIAVVAGFDGIGHDIFRYPLLGGHWQHHLVYVPPASDGKPRDYEELYKPTTQLVVPRVPLSYKSWLNRLATNKVTHVMLLGPPNVAEWAWIAKHPEQFTLERAGDSPNVGFFAFHPQQVR